MNVSERLHTRPYLSAFTARSFHGTLTMMARTSSGLRLRLLIHQTGGFTRIPTENIGFEDQGDLHFTMNPWKASGESNPDLQVRSLLSYTLDHQPAEKFEYDDSWRTLHRTSQFHLPTSSHSSDMQPPLTTKSF